MQYVVVTVSINDGANKIFVELVNDVFTRPERRGLNDKKDVEIKSKEQNVMRPTPARITKYTTSNVLDHVNKYCKMLMVMKNCVT